MAIERKGQPAWRIHPGEVLREEFLEPLEVTPYALAKAIHVSPPTVNEIVREHRGITPDMATRLAAAFGTTEQFWLNLQNAYEISRIKAENATELRQIHCIAAR